MKTIKSIKTIKVINRKTGKKEIETVPAVRMLKYLYYANTGKLLLHTALKYKFFTWLYSKYQKSRLSKRQISKFIIQQNIKTDESKRDIKTFKSFNDFFIRQLTKNARPISKAMDACVSPVDGRVFAYENIDIDKVIQIKNFEYKLSDLINDKSIAKQYKGGVCLTFRLAPADYHWFHFPDNGKVLQTKHIKGRFYSVSPLALIKIINLYCKNKRAITVFKSENYNKILYIEVGATFVGSIVQTAEANSKVKKGDPKGYFEFGGSTVILFFKAGTIKVDKDLIENTKTGYETLVKLGEKIGKKA